jgi:hypothetical protein
MRPDGALPHLAEPSLFSLVLNHPLSARPSTNSGVDRARRATAAQGEREQALRQFLSSILARMAARASDRVLQVMLDSVTLDPCSTGCGGNLFTAARALIRAPTLLVEGEQTTTLWATMESLAHALPEVTSRAAEGERLASRRPGHVQPGALEFGAALAGADRRVRAFPNDFSYGRTQRSALLRQRLRLLQPTLPEVEIIQRHDHEAVADFAIGDQPRRVVRRHQARQQILARIELHGMRAATVFNQHCKTGLAHDGGVREYLPDDPRIFSRVTALFAQLAFAGPDRRSIASSDLREFQFPWSTVTNCSIITVGPPM